MLTVDRLSVRFGTIDALRDVSVAIEPQRMTVVIGPNAAGKSTLLRCLAGALRPMSGSVRLDGQPAHRIPARALARRMAYVSQRPTVAAAFTVREVVELGRYALPRDTDAVNTVMREMELVELADRVVPTLSVGQQQRVAVARALAQLQRGGVLALDEPTAAMDMKHALRCIAQLRARAADGATVIMSVHDLTHAAALADDVLLLGDGRLVAHGPVDQVMTPQTLNGVFDVPFEWSQRSDGSRVLLPLLAANSR